MPVDPTDPDTFEDEDEDAVVITTDAEAPEADAAEQHADLAPQRDDRLEHIDRDSANEADRAEQARVVELDEDDYR
ncbi:hypothetical protein [Streptomyces cinnamoneus]|uniref:DUF5709 domain-containing protein n=1 Tax=Streptomyces cinnamoneus TaxID=53446 RepID=A0A918WR36_STRCJ|nr:hypothetical protein [Streptomyces cinnamoneus]GHC72560.1 hypothetical protein GCM10010507_59610 [Streptomyces cinnamoneus]